jgi:hypothetical protein
MLKIIRDLNISILHRAQIYSQGISHIYTYRESGTSCIAQLGSFLLRFQKVITLLDVARLQAGLDAQRDVGWNQALEGVDVLARKSAVGAERRRNHLFVKPEEGLGGLLHAWVLIPEAGHEDGRLARGVELGVHGALGKYDGLELRRIMLHDGCTVLGNELGAERALNHNVELSRPRVRVGRVETARAEEADSHGDAVSNERGESENIGLDRMAA